MYEITTVEFSRKYKFTKAELEIRKDRNESLNDAAKRLAIVEMKEELRNNFLEPGDVDFTITIK